MVNYFEYFEKGKPSRKRLSGDVIEPSADLKAAYDGKLSGEQAATFNRLIDAWGAYMETKPDTAYKRSNKARRPFK